MTSSATSTATALTTPATDTVTFPLHLTEITDAGLMRIEAACRAERLRRARIANPALAPKFPVAYDADDAILEGAPREVLAHMADKLASATRNGRLA